MTFRQKMMEMLEGNGLFDSQAKAVVDSYTNGPLGEDMKERMGDEIDGYPDSVLVATWMGVKQSALDWIEKNCPEHWARGMFA
jgi:hypothetical protein